MESNHPAAIVRIHRPELTPEEREKRMAEIKRAAENMVRACLSKKST